MIEAGVPCGDFVLEPGASCVFLGAGVGITPLLSMMKVAASNGAKVANIINTRYYYHLFQNTLNQAYDAETYVGNTRGW